MKFEECYDCSKVDWDDVNSIFQEVHWPQREVAELKYAFERSSFKIFLYQSSQLVGFGRTVDDGIFYASIVDVVVRPSHQNQYAGREIVNYLANKVRDFKFVSLRADERVQEFYLKLGWKRQRSALFLPLSEDQILSDAE